MFKWGLKTEDLQETEFWLSLRSPNMHDDNALLTAAIRLGQAGDTSGAYHSLMRFHKTARLDTWQRAQEMAQQKSMPVEKVEAVLEQWRSTPETMHDQLLASIVDHIFDVAQYVIASGDTKPLSFLNDVIPAMEREHERLIIARYPFGSQLGGYAHFHMLWHSYLALVHHGEASVPSASAALRLILAIGRSLRRQAESFVVHNIFAAGSHALLFIGRTMTEFREAEEWSDRALRWLDLEFDRSFYEDGGHKERNWGYGAHTIRRLTESYHFAHATGGLKQYEEHYAQGLQRAYQFFTATLGPKDIAPGYGDEGLHPMGNVLDSALESGLFPAGTSRDLGVDRSRSYFMPDGGFAFMRNGCGDNQTFASVSFGEFAGWHSHHDLLSMNYWSHGEILLEEVPRFGPYEHALDRLWRGPEAHNQLLVDGFPYDSRPCVGQDVAWYSDEYIDYFSAVHTAFRALPQQEHRAYVSSEDLLVRRTIVFVKNPGYAVVLDSVRPEQLNSFNLATSQWWHSPQPFRVLQPHLAVAHESGTERAGCLLAWARPESIRRFEAGIDFLPEETRTSIHPPHHEEWHQLRTRAWMLNDYDGCMGFATLLFPFQGALPEVSIRVLDTEGTQPFRAEVLEVTTPAGTDVFALNPELLSGFDYGRSTPARIGGPEIDSGNLPCAIVRLHGGQEVTVFRNS